MMDSKIEHDHIEATPTDKKQLERLEAIFNHFVAVQRQASDALAIQPIQKPEVHHFGNLTVVHLGGSNPPFEGLMVCAHCLTRASMLLRDLATVIDEMNEEVKKHRK